MVKSNSWDFWPLFRSEAKKENVVVDYVMDDVGTALIDHHLLIEVDFRGGTAKVGRRLVKSADFPVVWEAAMAEMDRISYASHDPFEFLEVLSRAIQTFDPGHVRAPVLDVLKVLKGRDLYGPSYGQDIFEYDLNRLFRARPAPVDQDGWTVVGQPKTLPKETIRLYSVSNRDHYRVGYLQRVKSETSRQAARPGVDPLLAAIQAAVRKSKR
jgi:hypothetical protein